MSEHSQDDKKVAATGVTDVTVPDEVAKRICRHMNEDHAVSVYAMAKSVVKLPAGWKLSAATLKKITLRGCGIQAITCSEGMCRSENIVYPFTPRLQSVEEIRKKLIQVHYDACAPRFHWLLTKPVATIIIVTVTFLTYATIVMGLDNLTNSIESMETANQFTTTVFGNAGRFSFLVGASFYFTVVAHLAEAIYVAHHSRKTVKLRYSTTLEWFILVALTGYPITVEFLDLLRIAQTTAAKKKKAA